MKLRQTTGVKLVSGHLTGYGSRKLSSPAAFMLSIAGMKAEIQKKWQTVTADVVTLAGYCSENREMHLYVSDPGFLCTSGKKTVYGISSPFSAKSGAGKGPCSG